MKYLYSIPSPFEGKRIKINLDLMQFKEDGTILYETAVVNNAVAILPVLGNGDVVLLKVPRHAAKDDLFEAPAGKIDDVDKFKGGLRQTELEAAKRELEEETGYTSEDFQFAGTFYSSPGWTTEKITCFIAKKLKAGKQNLEPTEMGIEVVSMPLEKASFLLETGVIKDLKTAYLLQTYKLLNGQKI